ncbi:MAG: class I poly(R)-hydroxyalkanoic acid synthase, partial [Pseudomonadota bacterium]
MASKVDGDPKDKKTSEGTQSYDFQDILDDPEALARNTAQIFEEVGKVTAAIVKPLETRGNEKDTTDRLTDFFTTISKVGKYWLETPERALEAQTKITTQYLDLWANSLKRFSGQEAEKTVEPKAGDRRFKDHEWEENPVFDFLKQAYLITANWATDLVEQADDLDPHTKLKASFYMTQMVNAVSPSNFVGET